MVFTRLSAGETLGRTTRLTAGVSKEFIPRIYGHPFGIHIAEVFPQQC